jgi:hypothetical protein
MHTRAVETGVIGDVLLRLDAGELISPATEVDDTTDDEKYDLEDEDESTEDGSGNHNLLI